jgi:hypothetical protein
MWNRGHTAGGDSGTRMHIAFRRTHNLWSPKSSRWIDPSISLSTAADAERANKILARRLTR